MNKSSLFKKSILTISFFCSCSAIAEKQCRAIFVEKKVLVEEVLEREERPRMFDLRSLNEASVDSFIRQNANVKYQYRVFRVFADTAKELLSGWDGRSMVLLGRDAELIFDAIQYLLEASETPKSVLSRVHLVNLSRPVMEASNYSQIKNYLEVQANIDLDRVLAGQQKALIFDTGNRGSIYLKIINLMLGQIKSNDPAWKTKLINVLEGIDFLLLASEEKSTLEDTVEKIKQMTEFNRAEIVQLLDRDEGELFFKQLDLPSSENKRLIPKNLDNRYDWVVENVEYQPHWEGRTLSLSDSGRTRKLPLENDPRVDKTQYLLRQVQFYQFLQTSKEVQDIVEIFRRRNGGAPRAPVAKNEPRSPKIQKPDTDAGRKKEISKEPKDEKPKEIKKIDGVKPAPGQQLAIGTAVELKNQIYIVQSVLGSGKRGRVYKVQESQSGELFALKIAKYNDEETLDSFEREYPKQVAYERAQVPHAKILKQEQFWILKELIEGQRADEWLETWNINKEPMGGRQMASLVELFNRIAQQQIYIGDLNPTNLIWNHGRWVIIDSGDATFDVSVKKAKNRFYEKNVKRWDRYFPDDLKRQTFEQMLRSGLFSLLVPSEIKVASDVASDGASDVAREVTREVARKVGRKLPRELPEEVGKV